MGRHAPGRPIAAEHDLTRPMLSTRRPVAATAPTSARVTTSVIPLTLRLWFNDLARALGSRWQAVGLLGLFGAAIAGYAIWSTVQSSAVLGSADSLSGMGTTYGAVMFTICGLTVVLCWIYAPSSTLVTQLLAVLPVRNAAVRGAARWLTLLIGASLGLLVLTPLWLPIAASGPSGLRTTVGLFAAALGGALTMLAITTVVQLVMARLLRLSPSLASGFAALASVVAAAIAFAAAMPLNHHEPGGPHAALTGPFLEWFAGSGTVQSAMLFVSLIGASIATLYSLNSIEPLDHTGSRSAALRLPGSSTSSLVRLEALQILRYTPNLMMLVFANGVGLLCAFWMSLGSGEDPLGVGIIVLTILSAWGVGAYGPTCRHHWIYRAAGRADGWILPKLCAVLSIWGICMAIHGTWLVLIGGWSWRDLLLAIPTLLVEVLISCAVGVLLPVSPNTSISGVVSESIAMLLIVATAAAAQAALASMTSLALAMTAQVSMVALAVSLYIAAGHGVGTKPVLLR